MHLEFRHPMFEGLIVTSPICDIQLVPQAGLNPLLRQQRHFVIEIILPAAASRIPVKYSREPGSCSTLK